MILHLGLLTGTSDFSFKSFTDPFRCCLAFLIGDDVTGLTFDALDLPGFVFDGDVVTGFSLLEVVPDVALVELAPSFPLVSGLVPCFLAADDEVPGIPLVSISNWPFFDSRVPDFTVVDVLPN